MTVYDLVHPIYDRLTSRITNPLTRQRIRLMVLGWPYWRLFTMRRISLAQRLALLVAFLRIDWNVLNGHYPGEMAQIAVAMDRRRDGGAFVEAGCWQGGSSA